MNSRQFSQEERARRRVSVASIGYAPYKVGHIGIEPMITKPIQLAFFIGGRGVEKTF